MANAKIIIPGREPINILFDPIHNIITLGCGYYTVKDGFLFRVLSQSHPGQENRVLKHTMISKTNFYRLL